MMKGIKRVLALSMLLVVVFAYSITGMAAGTESVTTEEVTTENSTEATTEAATEDLTTEETTTEAATEAPTVATDATTSAVLGAPDTEISDIARLLDGESPSEITGNAELADFSIYSAYTVTIIGADTYESDEDMTLTVNVADISSEMDVEIMFLDEEGGWDSMSFAYDDGKLSFDVTEEGQVAVFRYSAELVATAGADDTSSTTTSESDDSSPKTYDNIMIYVLLTMLGAAGLVITSKKVFKKQ